MAFRGIACDACVESCEKKHQKQGGGFKPFVSFFKILFGDDHNKILYLSPEFARTVKHLANKNTLFEDISGRQWHVTLSRIDDSLAFRKGWVKFYRDHGLEEGQLLTFDYIEGSNRFIVHVYGVSGKERKYINNEKLPPRKRSRRNRGTTSEDDDDVYSGYKPISATSISSRDERCSKRTNLSENDDSRASQHLQTPTKIKDSVCMINREDECYEERTNILYDLSVFEMENKASNANTPQKSLMTELDPPLTENAPHGDGVTVENALGAKISLPCIGISQATKPAVVDSIEQTKSPVEENLKDSQLYYQRNKEKSASSCADISIDKFAERKPVAEKKIGEFCISSSAVKDPLGKKPQVVLNPAQMISPQEKVEPARMIYPQVKVEPARMISPHMKVEPARMISPQVIVEPARMISPHVKVEPGLLDETIPYATESSTCPFSAEVKSHLYLKLPVALYPARGGKLRGEGVVVFLKDSMQRKWPVVYREYYRGRAFTVNWSNFCKQNNVKPGDKCRFAVVDVASRTYRVDVARRSG